MKLSLTVLTSVVIVSTLIAVYVTLINIEEQKKIAKQPLLGVVYRR